MEGGDFGGATEGGDPGEGVELGEADVEGLPAAHAEAGDGAVVFAWGEAVGGFDEGERVFFEFTMEGGEGLVTEGGVVARDLAQGVTVEHEDDHGRGFAGGDEAVEDPMGFAVFDPGAVVVAAAVLEDKEGVAYGGVCVVAGRGVDPEFAGFVEGFGEVAVLVDGAVGDVLPVPGSGRGGGDVEYAALRLALGFEGGV